MKSWDEMSPEEQEELRQLAEQIEQRQAETSSEEREARRRLPSVKRFDPIFNEAFQALIENQQRGDWASFDDLETASAVLFQAEFRDREIVREAFEAFASVDDSEGEIRRGLTYLLLVALGKDIAHVERLADRELASLRGLTAKAEAANSLTGRARTIASELWSKDASRSLRVGDMAEHVYGQLLDEGVDINQLPDRDRVRKWIRPVAPEYAKRPGRAPRKS